MTDNSTSNMPPTREPAVVAAADVRRSVQPRQITPTHNPFDTAPFYRKRWMVVVSALIFIPLTLVILLSGPVYQGDGVVWDLKRRVGTAVFLVLFMVLTFIRLGAMSG